MPWAGRRPNRWSAVDDCLRDEQALGALFTPATEDAVAELRIVILDQAVILRDMSIGSSTSASLFAPPATCSHLHCSRQAWPSSSLTQERSRQKQTDLLEGRTLATSLAANPYISASFDRDELPENHPQ